MTMKRNIDTRLERDPRYAAAKARLSELEAQFSNAEKERSELVQGLGDLARRRAADAITAEAQAMISGEQAPDTKQREQLTASLAQVEHRVAVLREAVSLQRQTLGQLAGEVGRAICTDLFPAHQANVRAVVAAARALAECCRAEEALREELRNNGVAYSGYLRPMPLQGFDLTDGQGTLARFLIEAVQFDFITAAELPESLRDFVPPSPRPAAKPARRAPADGWVNA